MKKATKPVKTTKKELTAEDRKKITAGKELLGKLGLKLNFSVFWHELSKCSSRAEAERYLVSQGLNKEDAKVFIYQIIAIGGIMP